MSPLKKDLGIVLLANLFSKPLWLIGDNLVQNRIGHADYGLIGALLALGQWATALADWGLYALVTREMARSTDNYTTVNRTTLPLKLILTAVAGTLFIGVGWGIGYRGKAFLWLIALITYQLMLSYLQYFRAYFQGAQRFRIDAIFSAAEKLVALLLLAGTWSMLNGDLYVGILLAAGVTTAGVAGGSVWRQYGRFSLDSKPAALWHAFRQMTPFALMGYATALNERLNQILLERWVGAYENGLYWGAYRWFSAAMMYLWIVLPIFFARFAKLGRQKSPEVALTFQWGHLVSSLPVIAVAGIFAGAPEIFLWLFTRSSPAEIAKMSAVLQALAIPLALNALTAIYSNYLTAVGYEWSAFWLMVGASGINFLLCALLLKPLGAIGAAFTLGGSYLFYGIGFVWVFRKVSTLQHTEDLLFRLALLATLYLTVLYVLGRYVGVFWRVAGAIPLFIGFAWVLGILRAWYYAHRHR